MPRLEEIEDYNDIDNLEMDLAELDSSLRTPIAPKITPTVVRSQDNDQPTASKIEPVGTNEEQILLVNPETGKFERSTQLTKQDIDKMKTFQIIYPCYFDKNRSHKEGRRVPKELAVENPLAKTLSDAAGRLGLVCLFQAEKTHPQDFGNPGRIKVLLKQNGQLVGPAARFPGGKRQILKEIAQYMQKHPTTLASPREIPYGPDFEGAEPKKIPRVKGFKMNDIVPLHSPFVMESPMTKSIYEAPAKPALTEKQFKTPKNKYKVVRR
ncbi:hypothetical protein NCAS_0B01060 [Naumovozyma castellii]|uniref:Signal recognition particle SEC65 subunit n=1 Tax=Naumovozyma castellii TaxID=27288 RepID=G0VB66_NAUCA|nr:hypothetical protein NCAS_0B01060 [Naumovozyma castellii CBS 4309]CCC68190.1 hypothetical protein NCAS_0B01060 [Naumovozyma castellii CBS 4309]